MSAFLVTHEHINALIRYAHNLRYPPRVRLNNGDLLNFEDVGDCQKMAEILYSENIRSLNARYPDTIGKPENMPGKIDELGKSIRYVNYGKSYSQLTILKSCDCYDYQACETDDYENTDAAKIINRIRKAVIVGLPGYEAATWGID